LISPAIAASDAHLVAQRVRRVRIATGVGLLRHVEFLGERRLLVAQLLRRLHIPVQDALQGVRRVALELRRNVGGDVVDYLLVLLALLREAVELVRIRRDLLPDPCSEAKT
jgi:hypothetical protein